jgi:hypothetical protein
MYISIRSRKGLFQYSSESRDLSWLTGRLSTKRTGRLDRERSSQPKSIKVLYKTRLLPIR